MTMSVSVVMAVYNGHDFLAQQLQSVHAQLLAGDELLIVDDASTDGCLEVIRPAIHSLVRILVNDRNRGVIRSFERGLAAARNEVVFLCDQDDVWLPGKRAAFAAEFALDPAVGVVISDAEIIDQNGTVVSRSFMRTRGGFKPGVFDTLWKNRYLGCAMAVRRSVLRIALPFPAGLPMHDMWLGVIGAMVGRVSYISQPYLQYRRHDRNATPVCSRSSLLQMLWWRATLCARLMQRVLLARFRSRDS